MTENLWGYGKRFRFVHGALTAIGARTVLDIGSGNGSQLAIPLSDAGFDVIAIDTDEKSIARGNGLTNKVRFIHGDLSALPVAPFDAVILSEVLEHLHDPEALLREAMKYMAPDGLMVVTVPNGYGEFEIDKRLFTALRLQSAFDAASELGRRLLGKQRRAEIAGSDDESPHVQRFTMSRLAEVFRRAGLRVASRRATSFACGPFVAYTLGRVPGFVNLNARIADALPMELMSGWMFTLNSATTRTASSSSKDPRSSSRP
jgi:SAM-dependent methyltransferase